jgi:ketosteroid isomerase-like protein
MRSLRDAFRSVLPLAALCLPALAVADGTQGAVTSGPPRDVAAIEKRIDQWLDGYNKADVQQMMEVFSADFTDDAQSMQAPQDKAQATQAYSGVFARYDTHITGITDEIRVSGDMAFDRGHYTVTFTPKAGGTTVKVAGRFLEVWKREGGVWQVQHLMDAHAPAK